MWAQRARKKKTGILAIDKDKQCDPMRCTPSNLWMAAEI